LVHWPLLCGSNVPFKRLNYQSVYLLYHKLIGFLCLREANYRLAAGKISFLPVCPSVRPSVRPSSVRPSVCPSVRSFICYQNCEHDILKTNEPILMQIGTSGPRGEGVKRSTLGSGGQSSRSHEARFGGLTAASFSAPSSSSLSSCSLVRFANFCFFCSCGSQWRIQELTKEGAGWRARSASL